MAIVLGNEVALAVGSAIGSLPLPLSRPGEVTFGVALSNTPCEVAWYNGEFSTDIPETALDLITGAPSATTITGRVVTFNDSPSPEYNGTVVRQYSRDRNNAGAPISFVLIRTRNGQLIEAQSASVTVVPGQ